MVSDQNKSNSPSLEEQIVSLTQAVQSNRESLDDATRFRTLKAARGLLDALGSPPETVMQDVVLNPVLLMALRMGVQLGVFQIIRDHQGEGATTEQIAHQSGASIIVVACPILKLLAAAGYVSEVGVQAYKPSPLTMVMSDGTLEATTRACFDIGNYCTTYAPEYFRRNNNQFPTSAEDTPFQLAKSTPLSYFAWLGENPSLAKDFQQWMTLKQQAAPNWVDWFDIQGNLLGGFRNQPDDVLLVDVGGGEGHYLHAFNDKFPDAPGRRILQDLPQVISTINNTPKGTELMAHDFFTVQPVKGARAYYMHWILHDWRDEQAQNILSHIVDAMEPGYSKLIINDQVIPDRDCDFATACISIMMMLQVGAFERTEKQWRALLTSVGLKDVSFYQPPGNGEGIIVATKA
ncbi:O-methyltransferase-domain-containing protein [Aspergillus caelatus]|uniref:O-methyltransferase-domain-containing protein n=1 Tax=Aspergillus caelatus TaxID=61420 RepID=A0A5N7ADD8_9EURO|nr:O-methyltransferase-domain-containing protein [Aspergillus caelatus]KAE8367887.1 O-methyltransferase-domain-containing protein [Aspergillus caelatus]